MTFSINALLNRPSPTAPPLPDNRFSGVREVPYPMSRRPATAPPLGEVPTFPVFCADDDLPQAYTSKLEELGGAQRFAAEGPRDLKAHIDGIDKFIVVIDNSGSMGGKGSVLFDDKTNTASRPTRWKELEIRLTKTFDVIFSAGGEQKEIEFVPINGSKVKIRNSDDIRRFFRENAPSYLTPMARTLKDLESSLPSGQSKKIQTFIVGDGDDNSASPSQMANIVLDLSKKSRISLMPMTSDDGGLAWMNKADRASVRGTIDTNDDYLSEYAQVMKTMISKMPLGKRRFQAGQELRSAQRDLRRAESPYISQDKMTELVLKALSKLHKLEQTQEFGLSSTGEPVCSEVDLIIKTVVINQKYDGIDEVHRPRILGGFCSIS